MGVTGLWKLIEPCGKPVPVETLEGKILAVDISIWLHQAVKGFQDNKGSALSNAHLLGLFHRLCKLLYYRVRPVFIFDGCVPQLKRDTIARRQQQRNKLSNEADRIQALLLQSLAKEKVVQQALGSSAEQLLLKSPVKRLPTAKSKSDEDDLFKLPELPAGATAGEIMENNSDHDLDTSASASDSSFDESTARRTYDSSLQAIDVKSQHFRNLPADVRHEILTDIKETRKQSSWGRLHELPARSDDFSSFQMKRLLKRRAVQESLEKAEEEMGGHTLTYTELCNFFNEEGIVTPTAIEQSTRQISSDEHTRFLLVRDLKKKALESDEIKKEIKCETIKEETSFVDVDDEKPSTSRQVVEGEKKLVDQLGIEYDADLAKAIALSLEETSKVYDEKDYDYDSDQDLRLNREQSKQLRHAAKGPARAYMIEYGGMNDEEVENIMESTQLNSTQSLERHFESAEDKLANNTIEEAKQLAMAIEESQKEATKEFNNKSSPEVENIIDSDTDSDLEEVKDDRKLEICVDINKSLKPTDDIFSDVFDQSDSDDDLIEVKDKIESFKETEKSALLDTEIIELKDSQEQTPVDLKTNEIEDKPQAWNVNSIIADLQKQTEDVKNIKLSAIAEDTPKSALSSILDDLKKQTNDVKNIKLDQIKLTSNNIIELSSEDETAKEEQPPQVVEVIQLCDESAENQSKPISPNKTPSKNKSITDYFETNYVVKRTPDKSQPSVTPPGTPKVPKPFYRKRTPKSGQKRPAEESSDDGISPNKKSSKAAKSLFVQAEQEHELAKPLVAEDVIKDAANALKSQKTSEELQTIADSLAQERKQLELERNRQDRMGMSISQRMTIDCQDLLRLFGIPYIVAPMEAEAQCAFLNASDLTQGTITDDSDIWLFGGRTVYKNFFAQNKHVLEFRSEQIEQTFNCNREKLIQLACLVGSDYTTGIHGIGAVTALEILASFSAGTTIHSTALCNQSVLETLIRFRDWWQAHKSANLPPGSSARLSLRKKLKNIELHEGFPSTAVVEAYLEPKVDDNRDAFTWGTPDVESIREFARKSFGWTTSKTDDILMPVIKKINDKKIQGSIRNYFTAKSALRVQQPQVSKRVQTAIDKMSGKLDKETPEKPKKTSRARRTKAASKESDEQELKASNPKATHPKRGKRKASNTTEAAAIEEATTENLSTIQSLDVTPRKCPRIPHSTEVIPQRERDLEQMRVNKAKAAEVFRKASKN